MASTSGEADIKTDYPVDSGVGDILNLIPEEGSLIVRDERTGL